MTSLPADLIPTIPDEATLGRATALVRALELACDEGRSDVPELAELQMLCGKPHLRVDDYHAISGAMSYKEAATLAFCPQPRRIENLNFEVFCELCETLLANIASDLTQYWYKLYELNARNPDAGDLIFRPPQDWIDRLKARKAIPEDTEWHMFSPSPLQLAEEAWRDDLINGI